MMSSGTTLGTMLIDAMRGQRKATAKPARITNNDSTNVPNM